MKINSLIQKCNKKKKEVLGTKDTWTIRPLSFPSYLCFIYKHKLIFCTYTHFVHVGHLLSFFMLTIYIICNGTNIIYYVPTTNTNLHHHIIIYEKHRYNHPNHPILRGCLSPKSRPCCLLLGKCLGSSCLLKNKIARS